MSRIKWNTQGERFFEAGVDRGVLYVGNDPGVPWNGLISVVESPKGGKVTPYYIDGFKRLNYVEYDEYKASVEAYTYPEEFAVCDGSMLVNNGLFATEQKRKPFGLVYRTLVGNDLKGVDHGYKLHVVYNATASPSDKDHNTVSDILEPFNFQWEISTKPSEMTGYKPTSHFVIDTRQTPANLVSVVEDIFYGTITDEPRLPSVNELMFLFNNYNSMFKDAGTLVETYYEFLDAGYFPEEYTDEVNAGGP